VNWILNFLWVLVIEYIQNVPITVGFVVGISSIKRGLAWWKWSLMYVGGSFACAVAVSSTEWIKVMATTRTANQPNILRMLNMGAIFSIACGLLVAYFILTSQLKNPSLADVAFGLLIGMAVATIQARNISPALVTLHSLGFAAVGGSLVMFFRRSAEVAPGREMLTWVGWLTLAMSMLIVIFDYVPFLRS